MLKSKGVFQGTMYYISLYPLLLLPKARLLGHSAHYPWARSPHTIMPGRASGIVIYSRIGAFDEGCYEFALLE